MIKVVFQFTQYIKSLYKLFCNTSVNYKYSPSDLHVWSRPCYSPVVLPHLMGLSIWAIEKKYIILLPFNQSL